MAGDWQNDSVMSATSLKNAADADLENGDVFSAFDRLRRAAGIALGGQDWALAVTILQQIQGIILTFGNTQKQSGSIQTKIEWDGENLDKMIQRCRILANQSAMTAGMTQVKYEYKRPEGELDYN